MNSQSSSDNYQPLASGHHALTRSRIVLYDTEYALDPLDRQELDIFDVQFPLLLGPAGSAVRQIQLQRVAAYIVAIRVMKNLLESAPFRGFAPEDTELGFQLISPQLVNRTSWRESLVAGNWRTFVGASQGVGHKMGNLGIVVTHAVSRTIPLPYVAEFKMTMHRARLIASQLGQIGIRDSTNGVTVYPLPTLLVVPQSTWLVQLRAYASGVEELELGGLVIGLGQTLRGEGNNDKLRSDC